MGISTVVSSFNSAHSTAEPSSLKLYQIASLVQKLTAPGVEEGKFEVEFANLPEMESLVGQILKDAMSLSQPTPANLASIRFMLGELKEIAPQNVHSVAGVAAHFSASSEVNEIFEQAQKENTPGAYEPTSPEAARKEAEETENESPSYWTRGLGVGLIALVTIAGGTALYRSLQNGAPKPTEPSLENDAPIAEVPSQLVCPSSNTSQPVREPTFSVCLPGDAPKLPDGANQTIPVESAQVDFPRPQESLGLPPGFAVAAIGLFAYETGVVETLVVSPIRKITEILRSPAPGFITKIAEVLAKAHTYWTESGPRIWARSRNEQRNSAFIRELVGAQRRRERRMQGLE